MNFTLGELKQILRKRPRPSATSKCSAKIRHVEWKCPQNYALLRSGRTYDSESAINKAFEEKTLDEGDVWYWVHTDDNVVRSKTVPKYVATFNVGSGRFLNIQQQHLRQIYQRAGRKFKRSGYSLMADGTPYWVDKYAVRVFSEHDSKKKYQQKKRKC
jgi:hypothetical protein